MIFAALILLVILAGIGALDRPTRKIADAVDVAMRELHRWWR